MRVYLDLVVLLNFLVDLLLLLGTDRLCGRCASWKRLLAASALGGVYGGVCLFPRLTFLGNTLWRAVFLILMAVIAFGACAGALRRGVLFFLLSMALGGLALGLGDGGPLALVSAALGLTLICALGFRGRAEKKTYVPVELSYGTKHLRFMALRDTGNDLRDPITGKPVLVVSAEIGQKLLGLTQEQIRSPVSAVTEIPGLRLIPYHTISGQGSLLPAIRVPEMRVGQVCGGGIVAFSPEKLDREGIYQGLTGGMV